MGLPFKPMLSGFSHLNTREYIVAWKSVLLPYSRPAAMTSLFAAGASHVELYDLSAVPYTFDDPWFHVTFKIDACTVSSEIYCKRLDKQRSIPCDSFASQNRNASINSVLSFLQFSPFSLIQKHPLKIGLDFESPSPSKLVSPPALNSH